MLKRRKKDNLFYEELKFSSQIYSALFWTEYVCFKSKRILPFKSSLQYILYILFLKNKEIQLRWQGRLSVKPDHLNSYISSQKRTKLLYTWPPFDRTGSWKLKIYIYFFTPFLTKGCDGNNKGKFVHFINWFCKFLFKNVTLFKIFNEKSAGLK